MIEEEEMKIEYFESTDNDPLLENYDENPTETKDTVGGSNSDTGNLPEFQTSENTFSADIKTWQKEIDETGRYVCRFCDLTYSTIQTLRYHVKLKHPDEANYLKNNVAKNLRNQKPKCHICKNRFKILAELRDHVKQKHPVENIVVSCCNCDATFTNCNSLVDHLYLKHKIRKKNIFFCDICGYRTLKSSHLNLHKKTHYKDKNLKCKLCDYQTYHISNLNIHERQHRNEKSFVCPYENCEYRSHMKTGLRSHQLIHNRERNVLYCDKCGYKTVYRQSLRKHIDSHSRNCIKTFLSEEFLLV